MGIRSKVSRSTLANANELRDWRIYSDFAQILIHEARSLYVEDDFGLELKETVYALDSSTIDLCLSIFPWAQFRKTKAAIKLHTLLDLCGDIPTFIWITDGKVHDVNVLDYLIPEPGAIYIMDRAYLDFQRLYQMHQCSAVFVTRSKTNTGLRRLYSQKVDKTTGVRYDQIVLPTGFYAKKDYPAKLRRIKFFDAEKGRTFIFLTNQFTLPALTIAELYRYRWRVEIFFKWIKTRVLIIDDEYKTLEILGMRLSQDGFEVTTATSGEAGLKLAYETHPDAILLDIVMPGMDGFKACRRLREVTDAVIMLVTVKSDSDDVIRGLHSGADDYLVKPYNYLELLARLYACLRRRADAKLPPLRLKRGEAVLITDPSRRLVFVNDGRSVQLTPKELICYATW